MNYKNISQRVDDFIIFVNTQNTKPLTIKQISEVAWALDLKGMNKEESIDKVKFNFSDGSCSVYKS